MTRRMLLTGMYVVLFAFGAFVSGETFDFHQHTAVEESGFNELMRRPPPVSRQKRMARLNQAMQEKGVSMSEALAAEEPQRIVGLTILDDFPDVKSSVSPQTIDTLLSGRGTASGSVYDYFYEMSGGLLEYTNIVTPFFITAEHNIDYYPSVIAANGGIRARELVTYVLNELAKRDDFDFSEITVENGAAVALNIFYATTGGSGPGPHASPAYMNLFVPVTVGGITFNAYQMTNLDSGLSTFFSTFVHENGHLLFGWPDVRGPIDVVGRYCVMAHGIGPMPVNPYFRDLAGWMNITDITGMSDTTFTIAANSNQAFYFSRNGDEGYYIEARRRTGFSANLPGEGLIIWHVHAQGMNMGGFGIPFPMVKVVWANDSASTATPFPPTPPNFWDNAWNNAPFQAGGGSNNTTFSKTSSPAARWHDGKESDINITEISDVGSVMTFRFTNPNPPYQAVNNVLYIDENGVTQTANNVMVIDSNNVERIGNLNGWYLVRGNLERNTTLRILGEAHIILEDNSDLTVTGTPLIVTEPVNRTILGAGIYVPSGNSLTIYAQRVYFGDSQPANESNIGKLTAIGNGAGAGIGGEGQTYGGAIVPNSGTITINGGIVMAFGGTITDANLSGAGIGGGSDGAGGNITINGGMVTATGGNFAAGIGGGRDGAGDIITINGGMVTATGGNFAAGIGGSYAGTGGIITINGGMVTTTSGNFTAGIGGGRTATNSGTLTMNGNAVVFTSSLSNGTGVVTDTAGKLTNGILFIGNSGTFYGDSVTLMQDVEILANRTLTIPKDAVLTIPSGVTLTIDNTATLTNDGTILACEGNIVGADRIFHNEPTQSCVIMVTWNANGGTPAPVQIFVNQGGSIEEPQAMTRTGFTFAGWYTTADFSGDAVSFPITNVTSTITLFARWDALVSVLEDKREVPPIIPNDDVAVITPIKPSSGKFTAGPNPVSQSSGKVAFYWDGGMLLGGTLFVYDVSGNFITRISISDNSTDTNIRRAISSWDLSGVSTGTYLVRGVLNMMDGSRKRVSAVVGVVK